jgi:hypothetical protein
VTILSCPPVHHVWKQNSIFESEHVHELKFMARVSHPGIGNLAGIIFLDRRWSLLLEDGGRSVSNIVDQEGPEFFSAGKVLMFTFLKIYLCKFCWGFVV